MHRANTKDREMHFLVDINIVANMRNMSNVYNQKEKAPNGDKTP